jgi:hypothetical protein
LTGEQIGGKNLTYELTSDEADLIDGYRQTQSHLAKSGDGFGV